MGDRFAIGRIQRSHGTEGYLRVQSYSGETTHFVGLQTVYVESESAARVVEDVREVNGGVLMKLAGVDRKEQADVLQGAILWADSAQASPLGAGEYYVRDLCGCEVRRGGEVVGTVAAFVEGGATGLMEVRSTKGTTFLVPFVDACVGDVSVERRLVELREGFEIP